ncbi:MAG: hypothetical protein ABIE03_05530 [Patescibacteria group bacterium]|nr:hypothetical protein [Patescibacteria group bacterium]
MEAEAVAVVEDHGPLSLAERLSELGGLEQALSRMYLEQARKIAAEILGYSPIGLTLALQRQIETKTGFRIEVLAPYIEP